VEYFLLILVSIVVAPVNVNTLRKNDHTVSLSVLNIFLDIERGLFYAFLWILILLYTSYLHTLAYTSPELSHVLGNMREFYFLADALN
jgi:hypothetical protein